MALKGVTLAAALKDIVGGLKLLPRLKRFRRYAIVTDTAWIEKVVGLEDKLLPGLDVRAFSLDEADEARAWVVGSDA